MTTPLGVTVASGVEVSLVSDALTGPTQVIRGPDDRLWVAELNGGERANTGRVVALAEDGSVGDVLLDELEKPTGIAVLDGHLWVMLRRSLVKAPLAEDGSIGTVEVVLDDLPFNGRSETTLSVLDGDLLYATTGVGSAGGEGSGRLWTLATTGGAEPEVYATGFKNAYAHVVEDGAVVSTEIGDGSYDGEPPPDELVRVSRGDDAGWPRCLGDRQPVAEFGGSEEVCAGTAGVLATFAPRATPTGVARWGEVHVVALWVEDRVVTVPVEGGEPTELATGLDGPQHLLVDGDRLLLTDHRSGRILAFERR